MCSAAEGSDLLAIEVADELGMPVHINLPMQRDVFKEDFRDEAGNLLESWGLAQKYIDKAIDPHSSWTFRVALSDGIRPGCYHDANLQMLEAADVLVAIHNGINSKKMGGTSEVIQIAGEGHLSMPVIVLDPTLGGEVTSGDEWCPQGETENKLTAINGDLASPEAENNVDSSQRTGGEAIWEVHQALDNVANNTSKAFRGSLWQSIWLHFLATTLATFAASFAMVSKSSSWNLFLIACTSVEFIMVAYAYWLVLRSSHAHANPRWRRARLAAEISDSLIQTAGLVDPLCPIVVRHDADWKRFALSVSLDAHRQKHLGLSDKSDADPRSEFIQSYRAGRIEKQLEHFRLQSKKAALKLKRWHKISEKAPIAAAFFVLLALFLKVLLYFGDWHYGWLKWVKGVFVFALPILVPLVAGLASSLILASDAARRSTRYEQVIRRLEKYKLLIPSLGTSSATQRVVLEVEDILLDEIIEWDATVKNMGH